MSRGSPIPEDNLAYLYYDCTLSMQQVANRLGCSVNKIVYWMNQYGFERRDWSEATYVYRNPDGDPFEIRLPQTDAERVLFGVGIGLYMGEGTKPGHRVCLANTNPGILRVFIRFLETFCGVQRNQLRAGLNVYDDCDVETTMQWWEAELGLTSNQFFKPTVQQSRGGTYKNKSVHGTVSIYFSNFKLLNIINGWCEQFYQ